MLIRLRITKYNKFGRRILFIAGFGNIILEVYEIELNITHLSKRILMQKKKKWKYDDDNNIDMSEKLLICIYTNKDKNEFAIGLKEDENFRAMTKADEFYTRFVDAFDQIVDKNKIDWEQELKNWIAAAKKNETIFVEVDLTGYNEVSDRKLSEL